MFIININKLFEFWTIDNGQKTKDDASVWIQGNRFNLCDD